MGDTRDHAVLSAGDQALVTGGAGFIGSHLCEQLLARGMRVVALDNLSTGATTNVEHLLSEAAFELVQGSASDSELVARLIEGSRVVFHLAAAVGVELILEDPVHVLEDNILAAQTVLRAASRRRVRLLFASSSEVYGKSERVPFREEDDRVLGPTSNARWSYSTSKAVGEYLCLAHHRQLGLPATVFRLFNTIGPRQSGRYGMVVPRLVGQALRAEPLTIYGDGRQTRSFCDVDDAVRGILSLADQPTACGEVFNIGGIEEITIRDLAARILSLVDGRDAPPSPRADDRLQFIPYEEAYEPGFEDMRRRVPSTEKLRRLTAWQPEVGLEETLARIITHQSEELRRESRDAVEGGLSSASR